MTSPDPIPQIDPTAASDLAGNGALLLDVRNMAGGMTAWARSGLPITTDDGTPGTVG